MKGYFDFRDESYFKTCEVIIGLLMPVTYSGSYELRVFWRSYSGTHLAYTWDSGHELTESDSVLSPKA